MDLFVGREWFVRFEGAVCRESGAAQAAEPTWRLVGLCYRVFFTVENRVFTEPPPSFQQHGQASRSEDDAALPLGRRCVIRFVTSDLGKPLITGQREHLLGLRRGLRSRADFDGVRKRAAQEGGHIARGGWGSL